MPKKTVETEARRLRALFTAIAAKHLEIETLEIRNRDSLDFHAVGVAGLAKALEEAYRAGCEDGIKLYADNLSKALGER